MQFYKRSTSGKKWYRNPLLSFISLMRDYVIFLLPIKRLPRFLVRLLYGVNPQFIFFVHARRLEDIFIALPFLVPVRRLLGRQRFMKILPSFPPFVLDVVKTKQGIDGLVVTSIFPSEILLRDRKISLRKSVQGLFFSSKIASKSAVFGLGGLWPMVTRGGKSLERHARPRHIMLTNGHSGTLLGLLLAIKKMVKLAGLQFDQLKVAILGVGKMGTNLARALHGKVAALTLIDINERRLDIVEDELKQTIAATNIQTYTNRNDVGDTKDIIAANHIAVCTTSNIRRVLRPEQIPNNTIIIDDSRPEGIPRNLGQNNYIVLEGGLLKIKGVRQTYDFGFGVDENVFGCLAESFLLSADDSKTIHPTLGAVDFNNFERMIFVHQKLGLSVGDFKCCDEIVDDDKIAAMLRSKTGLTATIPFKNICWVLKVEDPRGGILEVSS